jgi:quinohemoprotein amine dehydrogenase
MKAGSLLLTTVLALCAMSSIAARLAARASGAPASIREQPHATAVQSASDEGIPVTNDTVRRKCGTCHSRDDKGRLSRISYRRTTPEGWELTIKRMVSLHKLTLEPSEAKEILRYLADHHGLAPEETKLAAFEPERRVIEFTYSADKDTAEMCGACHSIGRAMLQRRTADEWRLLVMMHRGLYPLIDRTFLRVGPLQTGLQADGRPFDNRDPVDRAIAHLTSAFPLTTREWTAWSAAIRTPHLQGRWALAGYEPGKGPVFGEVVITQPDPQVADVTTDTTFTYARSGQTVTRHGRAIVYTGYQWRGKSDDWREVLFVDPEEQHAHGRWFTGAYDEFGCDVRLERVGGDPVLLGIGEPMLKAGGAGQELHLFGANLPTSTEIRPDFGTGVAVDRLVRATRTELVVAVSASPTAVVGRRSVLLPGATGSASLVVYSKVDFIKVRPQAGLSRLGGARFPKGYQQFEAVAYAAGPDGRADTQDDVEIGPVAASWDLEEYKVTYDDNDKDFVGSIDAATGLFTPNLDGPNPKRKHNGNNLGDVWVVASYPRESDVERAGGRTLKARAHLLVTVPVYARWDEPEVTR